MATYTKETALYDTGAIAGDIQNVQDNVNATNDDLADLRTETNQQLVDINESIYGDGTVENEGLQGVLNRATADLSSLSGKYNTLIGDVNSFFEFTNITVEGQTYPLLVIGSQGSDFKLNITNEQLQFVYKNNVIAFLTGTTLRVQDQLSFGNFVMYQRANGHFTLKKLDTTQE